MTQYVFEPQAPVTVPVVGSDEQFPVRRVYCVGRNYAAHAREMGFDPDREPPFFFCKPADAIVPVAAGETLALVGESGSGKSVTALSILRLLPSPPVEYLSGDIRFHGESLLQDRKSVV